MMLRSSTTTNAYNNISLCTKSSSRFVIVLLLVVVTLLPLFLTSSISSHAVKQHEQQQQQQQGYYYYYGCDAAKVVRRYYYSTTTTAATTCSFVTCSLTKTCFLPTSTTKSKQLLLHKEPKRQINSLTKLNVLVVPSTYDDVATATFSIVSDIIIQQQQYNNGVLSHLSSVLLTLDATDGSSSTTTWKQYVALGVILGVIIDILLGSPLAGAIAAPLRQQVEEVTGEQLLIDGSSGTFTKGTTKNQKERVDTEAMANELLDKVKNQQELNDYLEQNKTPKQRMDELRQQIDQQFEN